MSDRQPDFDPDAIARLRARFAAAEQEAPPRKKRKSAASKREEREHKARSYGDARKRTRKKSATLVALNNTYPPEFVDDVKDYAAEHHMSIKDVMMLGFYALKEREANEKEIT